MINQHFKYTLSIIIPCFNEIRTIKEIIFNYTNKKFRAKDNNYTVKSMLKLKID